MRWSLVLAGILGLGPIAAQSSQLAPEIATLSKIKRRMVENLARQPNYTCIQQVERSHRRLPRGRYELLDLVRIEVALVEGKEMFAWPGSRRFEEMDLGSMVAGGAIGTGNFATHARAVFQTNAPRFRYVGTADLNGQQTERYDFVVPFISSGYTIRVKERQATVGYHGSFWADVDTHELVRLEVTADDIPPSLGVVSANDAMDYGRVRIGASEFLLPRASELVMTDIYGNESRNRTTFNSCKQYSGESVLVFADVPDEEPAEESAPALVETAKEEVELPANLSFDVKLLTEIDSASAAVGDPVSATLDDAIKVKRRVVVPKGATLSGRILRLERHGEFTLIDFQFSELDSDQTHCTLKATVDSQEVDQRMVMQRVALDMRRRMANLPGLKFRGPRFRLRRGERVRLRTQSMVQQSLNRTLYQ
jgi:hypothetical protein